MNEMSGSRSTTPSEMQPCPQPRWPKHEFPALEENIGAATFALALDDFREIDGAVSEISGQGLGTRNICGK